MLVAGIFENKKTTINLIPNIVSKIGRNNDAEAVLGPGRGCEGRNLVEKLRGGGKSYLRLILAHPPAADVFYR